MKLRKLKISDAELMLEWMHDSNVNSGLQNNFGKMTIDDCKNFIKNSQDDMVNRHFAIVNDDDEYLGTISLKNVDMSNRTGEYAISVRTKAMGQGVSRFATEEIFRVAFEEIGLNKVYLCVFPENVRAIKFYKKCNFVYEGTFRQHLISFDGETHDLMWFSMLKEEYSKSISL